MEISDTRRRPFYVGKDGYWTSVPGAAVAFPTEEAARSALRKLEGHDPWDREIPDR